MHIENIALVEKLNNNLKQVRASIDAADQHVALTDSEGKPVNLTPPVGLSIHKLIMADLIDQELELIAELRALGVEVDDGLSSTAGNAEGAASEAALIDPLAIILSALSGAPVAAVRL